MPKENDEKTVTAADLRAQAQDHMARIAELDTQIEALVKERTAEKGKLRAVTNKIVTKELKE